MYSVWYKLRNRWTTIMYPGKGLQDPNNPFHLTLEEAEAWLVDIKNSKSYYGPDFEVRQVDSLELPTPTPTAIPTPVVAEEAPKAEPKFDFNTYNYQLPSRKHVF